MEEEISLLKNSNRIPRIKWAENKGFPLISPDTSNSFKDFNSNLIPQIAKKMKQLIHAKSEQMKLNIVAQKISLEKEMHHVYINLH